MATPLLRPPPGGDIHDGWQLEVGATVTFICASIAVGLRTFTRSKYTHMAWDDYLMLFALLQALVATVLDYVAVHWGLGRHLFYLTPQQAVQQEYYTLLAQVFCINALTFGKISLCLTYLRVLRGSQHKALKWALYTTAFLVFAVNTVVILAQYVQCNPTAKSWNPSIPGTCWKPPAQISLVLLQGSWSALTDFFLAAFPFVLFKDLHVGRRSKAILLGLMGLGVVTGAFAVVRTIQGGLSMHSTSASDVSFASISGLLWAGMERNIAIMIASIPAIRPMVTPFVSLVSRSFGYSRSKPTTGDQSYDMGRSDRFLKISRNFKNGDHHPFPESAGSGKMAKYSAGTSMSEEHILPADRFQQV
ncbi:hypothetical protein MMC27_006153 [Xylographa pallens]|nr:hypothetical protein [Xylographa pallens]